MSKPVITRRALCSALVVGLAVAALVASGGAESGKVAMLLPGSINDQSWNAAGYVGLQKLKDKGFEIAYSENVQAADHIEAMKDYARRGFSPVIGHSGRFLSAAQRVGPEFEKTGRARTSSRWTSPTSSSAISPARSRRG